MAQELNILNRIFKHQIDLYDENQENKVATIENQESDHSDFVKLEIEGFISKKNVSIDKGKVYLKNQTDFLYQKDGDEKPFLKVFKGSDLRLIKAYRDNAKVKIVGYFKRVDILLLNQKINKIEEDQSIEIKEASKTQKMEVNVDKNIDEKKKHQLASPATTPYIHFIYIVVIITLLVIIVNQNSAKKIEEIKQRINELLKQETLIKTNLQKEQTQLQLEIKDLKLELTDVQGSILMESSFFDQQYLEMPSSEIKKRLEDNISEQKMMIKSNQAIINHQILIIDGSKAKAEKLSNKFMRLALRAFNKECDFLAAKVKVNNIEQSLKKIDQSQEQINKAIIGFGLEISEKYKLLRKEEVELVYEYELVKEKEKEEYKILQEKIRDEELAQKQIEKELKKALQEEERNQQALIKARKELEEQMKQIELQKEAHMQALTEGQNLSQQALLKKEEQIRALEEELSKVQQTTKTLSQAQLTKAGMIYIISNIGSFGEDVYKIGMTRRLDPEERIYELSNASVPFKFDCHMMIKTDHAPNLEKTIHQLLSKYRINKVNMRKEFFKIPKNELLSILNQNDLKYTFEDNPKDFALEFQQSLAMSQFQS